MGDASCARCGQAAVADARFCHVCGAPLPPPGQHSQRPGSSTAALSLTEIEALEADLEDEGFLTCTAEAVETLPAGTALLVIKRGPGAGGRAFLGVGHITVGRRPDSDIFLDDITVSRRHAEIVRRDGAFTVYDLGSLNGMYVNRERVEQYTLSSGDEVRFGRFALVFLASPKAFRHPTRPEAETPAGRSGRRNGT